MSSAVDKRGNPGHQGASLLLEVHDFVYSTSKTLKSNKWPTFFDPSVFTSTILCQHSWPFVSPTYSGIPNVSLPYSPNRHLSHAEGDHVVWTGNSETLCIQFSYIFQITYSSILQRCFAKSPVLFWCFFLTFHFLLPPPIPLADALNSHYTEKKML